MNDTAKKRNTREEQRARQERLMPEIMRMRESGIPNQEILAQLPEQISLPTLERWIRSTGVTPRKAGGGRPDHPRKAEAMEMLSQGTPIRLISEKLGIPKPTIHRWRSNAERGLAKGALPTCPCGKSTGSTTAYYCSSECREKYGKKKQADPANQVTFNCETCGKEVTRWKGYGGGANKFCSNLCAAKHTKTVRHYMARDSDVVLDSTWEMLFYSTLAFLKIPVERTDREQGVEWREGNWYAPDFHLPRLGLWIEIKGQEDPEDVVRWAAFRKRVGPLAVLDRDALEAIRSLDRDGVEDRLRALSATTVAG